MQRMIRKSLLIVLCGGMMLQAGCLGSVAAIGIQLVGSLIFNNILDAILGPVE